MLEQPDFMQVIIESVMFITQKLKKKIKWPNIFLELLTLIKTDHKGF